MLSEFLSDPSRPHLLEKLNRLAWRNKWISLGFLTAAVLVVGSLLTGLHLARRAGDGLCMIPGEWARPGYCADGVTADAKAGDPREALKRMGIAWSEKNFWDAMRSGDDRAVALFLKDNMSISSKELHEVLTDRQLVRKAPLKRLIESAGGRDEFCSWDEGAAVPAHRSVLRFAQYAQDEAATNFVKRFCPDLRVADALTARLAQATKRLSELQAANKVNRQAAAECQSNLNGRRFLCTDADRQDRPALCGAVREYFDTVVCPDGRYGCYWADKPINPRSVAQFCQSRFPQKETDEEGPRLLEAAVKILN